MKRRIAAAAVLMFSPCMAEAETSGARLQLSTGAEYSRGDYGLTSTTEVLVVPLSARISWGDWSLKASVPYVGVRGPANVSVILDDDGSNSGSGSANSGSEGSDDVSDDGSGTPATANRDVSGLGDASLSLSYSFNAIAGSPIYADLTARTKFATGSESRGLGSGTTDYFTTGELGWDAGTGGVFVNGGRRFLGSNTSTQRVDGWQWGAGAWFVVGPKIELGLDYVGRQAAVNGGKNLSLAEASVTLRLARAWQFAVYGGAGLSSASADYTGGVTLTWHANGRRR